MNLNEINTQSQYKVKGLRVYASREWLAGDTKKYRAVFEQETASYIYAEFSIYNKNFDREEWTFEGELRAYELNGKQVCVIEIERAVTKEEPVVYIREGWGNEEPGGFWKAGAYCWEMWSENQKLASANFYVLDCGISDPEANPYFMIDTIQLYEAGSADLPEASRNYFNIFDAERTRYVWAEFVANNTSEATSPWYCELLFNFFSQTGEQKGSVSELVLVNPDQKQIKATVGWGADKAGSWYEGAYRLEILFLEQVLAVVYFNVAHEFDLNDAPQFFVPDQQTGLLPSSKSLSSKSEAVVHELDDMIGLEEVKRNIKEYITYLQFLKIRQEKGLEERDPINLHSVFIGNPGTGKTTIAKMLGKIYKDLGLLSRGHVYEVDRSELVGEFIGQTAPKVKEAIERAKGGILFIDEAYALARKGDDTKDFGKEVVEILVKEMTNPSSELTVIVAGYPDEMKHFLDSNPGLKSRFNQFFQFPDYTPQELIQIADYSCSQKGIQLDAAARKYLYQQLVEAYRSRSKSFGNARYVNSLLAASKVNLGLRIMRNPNFASLNEDALSTVQKEDIEKVFHQKPGKRADIPVDEALLKFSLRELQNLIGLQTIKKEIDELVKLVRFYIEIGKDYREEFSLHSVFLGNPGTGKTTIARLLSNIFKALGILEKGHLVECSRHELIAGYLGQTSEKTSKLVDSALGGTLFIDEAYTLMHDKFDSFGKEAIATLLKRMEDQRGQFVVIIAGYPGNMEEFLKANPGLKSRFDRSFQFEDYNPEELTEIALSLFQTHNVQPDEEAELHLKEYLREMVKHDDPYFGNARAVRKVIERTIKNQHLRLAHVPQEKRTEEMIRTLRKEDLAEFSIESLKVKEHKIGFRSENFGLAPQD